MSFTNEEAESFLFQRWGICSLFSGYFRKGEQGECAHSKNSFYRKRDIFMKYKFNKNHWRTKICLAAVLFISSASGLSPKICNYEIVNVFIENYPLIDDLSRQKIFFKHAERKVFEIKSGEWAPDSSTQAYITRIAINMKSSECQSTQKRYLYISKSCKTIMLNKIQYRIPLSIRQAIISNSSIKTINLKSCFDT
jgi:hypothetical protein